MGNFCIIQAHCLPGEVFEVFVAAAAVEGEDEFGADILCLFVPVVFQ